MDIQNFLASHPYAETTKRTYQDVLSQLSVKITDPTSLTAADLIQLLNQSEWGSSRQGVALAACKTYLRWKYGNSHPALSARIKRAQSKPQRALDEDTALQLLASFDPYTPKGARDLAICALLLDTGLRESELCRLQQGDTDTDKRVLQVIVKGGQWAAAVFSPETAAHIERWKQFRTIADGQGYLFTNIFTGEGLTPEGLYNIVETWGAKIGVKLSPHDLRRTFAMLSTTLTNTPERVLMEGGRWTSSTMINRYTRTLKLEAMRKYLIVPKLSR